VGHTVKRCPNSTATETGAGDDMGTNDNGYQNADANDDWNANNTGIVDQVEGKPAEEGRWTPGW
jgi:hypothetical protein